MALNALLKFTQGSLVGDGRALIVTSGIQVVVENSQGAIDLGSWRIELLYAPFGSTEFTLAAVVKTSSGSATAPTWSFTPDADVPGCYRIRLTVYSGANYTGSFDVDIRNVIVLTTRRGLLIPPPQLDPIPLPSTGAGSKPNELNVEGQTFGWAGGTSSPKILSDLFMELDDTIGFPEPSALYSNSAVVATPAPITYVGQGFAYNGALYIPEATHDVYYAGVEWGGVTVVPVSYEYRNYKRTHVVRETWKWPDFSALSTGPLSPQNSSNYRVISTHTLIDDVDNDRWLAVCWVRSTVYDGQGSQLEYRPAEYEIRVLNRGEPFEWVSTVRAAPLDTFYSSLMSVYSLAGYLWFLSFNVTVRCPLSDLSNMTTVESGVSHNYSSNWYYDPQNIYGDGEGRIIRSFSSFNALQLVRPSDVSVTHSFTYPSDSATFQFFSAKVVGYDAVQDRVWLIFNGYVSSTYGMYVASATLNRSTKAFEDIRAADISTYCGSVYDSGRGGYESAIGACVFNVKTPSGPTGGRSAILRATDNGSVVSFTAHYNTDNGGDYVIWNYYAMNPPLVVAASDDVAYVGLPDEDLKWFEFFQTSSGLTGSIMEGAYSALEYREVAQMRRDLDPAYAMTSSQFFGTQRDASTGEAPMVTGLQGWPLTPARLGGGAIVFDYNYFFPNNTGWKVKALPFLRASPISYSAPTYVTPVDNTEYNGDVYALSSSITYGQVSIEPNKQNPDEHDTTANFRLWYVGADSKVGQTNSTSGRKIRLYAPEEVTTYNWTYKLHGLTGRKANPPSEMFIKNAFEAEEWQWSVIGATYGAYGRWVLANRYRAWEHVDCSTATTTLFVGKGIARCATSTGPKTVVLPDFADGDDWIIVKDVDNNASANPITIQRNTGVVNQTIEGGTSNLVIDWDGGCIVLRYDNANNTDGPSNWEVIATNGGGATGGTDVNAVHVNAAGEISTVTEKVTPASADLLLIEDSADSNNKKRVQVGNLPGGGGGTDVNAVHVNVAGEINGLTEKTYIAATDQILLEDAADSFNKKRCRADNLPPFWDSRSFTLSAAQENNYGNSFAGQSSLLILTPFAGGTLLTGLNASFVTNSSYRKVLVNAGPDVLTLAHLNAGSSANNQFSCPEALDYAIAPGEAVILEYYSGKWSLAGGTPKTTGWVSYTPAWTASVNPAIGDGTLEGWWRRVGDSMEIRVRMVAGSTTTFGTGDWSLGVPAGFTVDSTKITDADACGSGLAYDSDGTLRNLLGILADATNSAFTAVGDGQTVQVQSSSPFTWASGDSLTLTATVPISGWNG